MQLGELSIFWWERNQAPKTFSVDREVIQIGREITNDLVIRSKSVSRKHGIIFNTNNGIHYVDYGSTTGSKINGKRIYEEGSILIKPGDVISLGLVDLTIALS